MKRISDKQRLDWLTRNGDYVKAETEFGQTRWEACCMDDLREVGTTPRAAIDAAIRQQEKEKR